MGRKEREIRGRRVAERSADTAVGNSADGSVDGVPGIAAAAQADANRRAACAALSYLLLRDDGWLRAVPDQDAQKVYLKWKFSKGRHANHYVMAVVAIWQWDYGLMLLRDKCDEVDLGTRRPVKDRPWNDDTPLQLMTDEG